MSRLICFWVPVCCAVIAAFSSTATHVDGGGGDGDGGVSRSKGINRCPTDVRAETRRCLGDYKERLDSLVQTEERFFPGLDVEVIRALCSLLEDSIRCAQVLNDACQKTQLNNIEEELNAHVAVSRLCLLPNIYEEYAINQNCFVRIRSESESCHQIFQNSIRIDERSSSSSSSSSSQRHHSQQQRQYCSHVIRLISCVKSHVRSNPSSCSRNALNLVGHLVRASLTSSVSCSDEQNATSQPTSRKAGSVVVNQSDNQSTSGASSVVSSSRFWHLMNFAAAFYLGLVWSSSSAALPCRRRRHHQEKRRLTSPSVVIII